MSLVAAYVLAHGGEDALCRVHQAAGIKTPVDTLMDERRWFTYEEKIALFEAAAAELSDPEVTRHVGETALALRVVASVRVLLRTLGSPRVVLSNIARANQKFSTVSRFELAELGRAHAVITYELRSDKRPHRLDCLFNQGLVSVIGPLFGMPLLDIEHRECQVLGAARCVYRVRWPARRPLFRRDRDRHLLEQVDALSAQLKDLQTTAADLVSTDDIGEVLARIVARAGVAVSAPRYLIAVRDESGELLVRSDGFESAAVERDAALDLLQGRDMGERVLSRPVASSRRDYGVLAAFYDGSSFFDFEEAVFEAYARNAAAALDVVAALEEARRRSSETAALLGLANALAELATPEAVAQHVADAMLSVVAAERTIVLLVEEGRIVVRAFAGGDAAEASRLVGRDIGSGDQGPLVEWLANTEPWIIRADTELPFSQRILSVLGVETVLVVPIQRRGRLLGASAAGFVGPLTDLDELMNRSLAVADHAAIALDNANLLAHVTHQALYDDVTDVASPSHFEEETERALARGLRSCTDVSLVFLDLDHFKDINDRFGHLVGDQVLRQVAGRLRKDLRTGDFVGRLGGDEFAVTLCGAGKDDALAAAERMRRSIEAPIAGLPHLRVSASFGVATAVGSATTYRELLHRGDNAMYQAKHLGRNTCVAAEAA